jgi:hypothetical protein
MVAPPEPIESADCPDCHGGKTEAPAGTPSDEPCDCRHDADPATAKANVRKADAAPTAGIERILDFAPARVESSADYRQAGRVVGAGDLPPPDCGRSLFAQSCLLLN